jgi:hypothetical protein
MDYETFASDLKTQDKLVDITTNIDSIGGKKRSP